MSEYSVFLLEPDELLREAFLSVLEEKGYAVYPFAQALEAQSFVEKIEFQIAVIDNDLCGIKTADVISAVKKAHPFSSV
ncbi:MAG: hypothetical protein PHQ54_03370, partial [Candidatus Omnitrophica bacterium]|nr:hypothetical protein [Candidatus Omnitrophota bacterium]